MTMNIDELFNLDPVLADLLVREAYTVEKKKILGLLLAPRGLPLLAYIRDGYKSVGRFDFNWLTLSRRRNNLGVPLYELLRVRDFRWGFDFPEHVQIRLPETPFKALYTESDIDTALKMVEDFNAATEKYLNDPAYGAF